MFKLPVLPEGVYVIKEKDKIMYGYMNPSRDLLNKIEAYIKEHPGVTAGYDGNIIFLIIPKGDSVPKDSISDPNQTSLF